MKPYAVQIACVSWFHVVMAATRVCVGGNVVDGRAPSLKGRRSPHHRVMSGTSCQDSHSPEAQANVKIKSLVEPRRVGLTQQVTPLVMRVCERCMLPPSEFLSVLLQKFLLEFNDGLPAQVEHSCVFLSSTMAHMPM